MKAYVIAFSTNGCRTAMAVRDALEGEDVSLFAKTTMDTLGIEKVSESMRSWTRKAFEECDAIVFVGSVGIAVREIAPFIKSKDVDPAIVDLDELGRFCIPLLSGHIGGANELSLRIAGSVGATPVVTTATDINGKISIDAFAVTHGLSIDRLKPAKDVSARILEGSPVGLISDFPIKGEVPKELSSGKDAPTGVYIGEKDEKPFPVTLRLIPRRFVLGIGCKKGTPREAIEERVGLALKEAGITIKSIRACASIDIKSDEEGLLSFAAEHRLPITFYTSEELNAVPGEFSKSDFVRSVTSVDCVCERSAVKASRDGRLVLRKFAGEGVTAAIAEEEFAVDFSDRKGSR
ncbi:Cobalamin biosynthesis protein CbiG [Thermoplasmatales archaeon BRNA1]|nr:Cobalamin biosynthesis protein CbiG [Thermoplasmatales archaeon BRNA1]